MKIFICKNFSFFLSIRIAKNVFVTCIIFFSISVFCLHAQNPTSNLLRINENEQIKELSDSLLAIAIDSKDIELLNFYVENTAGERRAKALQALHNFVAEQFELSLLENFYYVFGNEIPNEIKNEKSRLALLAESLNLHLPYKVENFSLYDEFIRSAAPSDKAFKAVQNLVAADVDARNWAIAANKVKKYLPFFKTQNNKINQLLQIINAENDKTIKIKPLSDSINTISGGEYSPVFPSGERLMYFSGTGRQDNLGGEDIFVSIRKENNWTKPKVISEFSTAKFNDAPVSVSVDGIRMLFVREGKFFTSQKTTDGWTEPLELNGPFYSQGRVVDGMFTPDGKGIIYSAIQSKKLNNFSDINADFGKNSTNTDIYISLTDDNNKWSAPLNIGKSINTTNNERSPFLHADMKTLYFSSDGHGGLGKFDVFKSERLSDTCWNCWSEPIHLGKELNTTGDDIGFKINVAGDKAYFARSKNSSGSVSVLILIDVSGSMSGVKLARLKTQLGSILKKSVHLNAEVALITYAGTCSKPLIDSCSFATSLRIKQQFVDNIISVGKTTTGEAYRAAIAYLHSNARSNTEKKYILVFTDEDICVCTKPDFVFSIMKQTEFSDKISTMLFDVSEDSILFTNLKTANAASDDSKLHKLFVKPIKTIVDEPNLNLSGNEDIYVADLPMKMRPAIVTTVSGKLKDAENKPVSAQLRWNDFADERNSGVLYSDPTDGSYYIVLKQGKLFEYYAKADSFVNESFFVDLKNETQPLQIENNIRLLKIDELIATGEAIRLNNVFFNFDESTLLPNSKRELKRWAEIIKQQNLVVELSGHTDSVGEEDYNLLLSQKRADAVTNFLIEVGCDPKNLNAMGYGKKFPRVSNQTAGGRAENRRVELKIIERK